MKRAFTALLLLLACLLPLCAQAESPNQLTLNE